MKATNTGKLMARTYRKRLRDLRLANTFPTADQILDMLAHEIVEDIREWDDNEADVQDFLAQIEAGARFYGDVSVAVTIAVERARVLFNTTSRS